jgi:Tfp pilus assembly protein PilF
MDFDKLAQDLRLLRASLPAASAQPNLNERARTYQNVGGFILRHGRLDAIIEALEKAHAQRA